MNYVRRFCVFMEEEMGTSDDSKGHIQDKIKPRINLEGRTKLETVIPLSTPFIIFVDPSSA